MFIMWYCCFLVGYNILIINVYKRRFFLDCRHLNWNWGYLKRQKCAILGHWCKEKGKGIVLFLKMLSFTDKTIFIVSILCFYCWIPLYVVVMKYEEWIPGKGFVDYLLRLFIKLFKVNFFLLHVKHFRIVTFFSGQSINNAYKVIDLSVVLGSQSLSQCLNR